MEKIAKYQQVIKQILQEYGNRKIRYQDLQSQIVADDKNGHYYLLRLGWEGDERIHNMVFHFDLINGKIWIQQNWTDVDIAQTLEELGVPKSDIVLGFQPTDVRPFTGYAVA